MNRLRYHARYNVIKFITSIFSTNTHPAHQLILTIFIRHVIQRKHNIIRKWKGTPDESTDAF